MIYAKTIPPEEVGYDFEYDAKFYDTKIYICGNRDFYGINASEIKEAEKMCEDFEYHYEHEPSDYGLTEEQFSELSKIVEQKKSWGAIEYEFVLKYLAFKNGVPYKRVTIRGCSQGDWDYLYVPSDMTIEEVREIEAYYFNLGTEVCIEDSDKELQPEEIGGYYLYFPTWDTNEIKRRIAEYEEVDVSQVVLYEFDGYIQTPKYKKA